jgi:ParB-like chromosome segregation protein Spo0J
MGSKSAKAVGARGRTETFMVDPDSVLLPTDPNDPFYDASIELPLEEAFINSVDHVGVIEDVIGIFDGTKIKIIVGRDRARACQEVKRRRKARRDPDPILLPVKLKRGTVRELKKLVDTENYIRRQIDPVARAVRMQKKVEEGYDKDEIATMFGLRTARAVDNALTVLDCSALAQRKMSSGEIPASRAPELAKLPHAEQNALIAKGDLKGARGRQRVTAARTGKAEGAVEAAPSKKVLRRVANELSLTVEAGAPGERGQAAHAEEIRHAFAAGLRFALGAPVKALALDASLVERINAALAGGASSTPAEEK